MRLEKECWRKGCGNKIELRQCDFERYSKSRPLFCSWCWYEMYTLRDIDRNLNPNTSEADRHIKICNDLQGIKNETEDIPRIVNCCWDVNGCKEDCAEKLINN